MLVDNSICQSQEELLRLIRQLRARTELDLNKCAHSAYRSWHRQIAVDSVYALMCFVEQVVPAGWSKIGIFYGDSNKQLIRISSWQSL